jgi:hypothetical protein
MNNKQIGIIVIVVIIILVLVSSGKKSEDVSSKATPEIEEDESDEIVPVAATPVKVVDLPKKGKIYAQSDDYLNVNLNGKAITKQHAGWAFVKVIPFEAKKGDILDFIVTNLSGPGALKATVEWDGKVFKTGSGKYLVNGFGAGIDVVTKIPEWKWAIGGAWEKGTNAKNYSVHLPSKWIWSSDKCTKCTKHFKLKLE